MTLGVVLIIASMVVFNALLAAYEIALASVSAGRLHALAEQHRPGARAAVVMKENMEASLAVVQVGITLVGAIAAATGGAGAAGAITPLLVEHLGMTRWAADAAALALVVLPLSAVTIVVGELMPKLFALRNKEWVCLKLSPVMRVLAVVAYPAVWVLEATVTTLMAWSERSLQPRLQTHKAEVSEMQELRAVVALARTSRLIGGQEEKIILGAARLSGRPIVEIMMPTEDIFTLDLDHTMAESLVLAHTDMHTRFPVCERSGDAQSICGYVNFKDIVSELRLCPDKPSLRGIVREMPELSSDMSIAAAMERMTRNHSHIAVVRDAQRRIVGMVTLEDILEELIGDILDEFDRVPTHVVNTGSGWVMGGGVPLERLEQLTGRRLGGGKAEEETRTLHDLVQARLGRPVCGGDILHENGVRVLVRKVRRHLVLEAQVTMDQAGDGREAADGSAAAPSVAVRGQTAG